MNADQAGFIFVTGANGRIGTAVMERFGQRVPVVGTDRRAEKPPPPGCVFLPVDFSSQESVREGLEVIRAHHGSHILSVIHLAAYYSFTQEKSPMYEEVTVRGTERLLRGLREVGFSVEQFVFSSTMLVHAPGKPGVLINEDSPMEGTWGYPASKIRTEAVIEAERGDTPAVMLRIAGVYDDECHSIPLANQMQRIYERQLTSRLYSGEIAHAQSYVHMDDVVDAIERTVDRRAELPPVTPLLIGEPLALSYDELQHSFFRLIHDSDWETIEVPVLIGKVGALFLNLLPGGKQFIRPWMIDRANDHYELDISRAGQLLGWQPQHTLRDTLPVMVAALKRDPLAWYRENDLKPPARVRKQERRTPPSSEESRGGAPGSG